MKGALIAGLILFSLFLTAALFGPSLAPYGADYQEKIWYEGDETMFAPAKPSPRHPLGSDIWGYDILSLMLSGARYTLLALVGVSALRLVLGVLVNLINFRFRRRTITLAVPLGLSAIPGFLFIYFLFFAINFNPPVDSWTLTALQLIGISLFGLPRFAASLSHRVEETERKEYVQAARSVGVGRTGIFFRHILPQLREFLALNFLRESISTLNLIGQLGIFELYLGGTRATRAPLLFHSMTHEWAGLVGAYRGKVYSLDWWIIAFPLGGYVLLLISLYLIYRGLEEPRSEV